MSPFTREEQEALLTLEETGILPATSTTELQSYLKRGWVVLEKGKCKLTEYAIRELRRKG